MPARVTVVIRARRRSFALLLAAPAWIGSVWAAYRRLPPMLADETGGGFQADAGVPALQFSTDGVHGCTGCGVCAEICPSRALSLRATRAPEGLGRLEISRFELEVGACIGCGRCVEDCPEKALVTRGTPAVAVALRSGVPQPIDLLDWRGVTR